MGIDLATWRARIGLNYCRQSRYACRSLPVQWRAARWGVGEVLNSTPLLLQGCMAVVSLSLILGYTLHRRPIGRCGCGKVCRPKLRGGFVPSAEVGGMADKGIIGVCLLLGVCAVVLALLLIAGDVERNPGPTGKEGSEQLDKVLPTVDDSPLGEDHLSDMLTEIMPVARNWKAIGILLGISYRRLGTIQTDNPGNASACFLDMLTCWLKRSYDVERFGEPTWRAVVKVVAHPAGGDNHALALSIAGKYSVVLAAAPQTTEQTPFGKHQYSCASNTALDDVFTSAGAGVSPGPSSSTQRPSFGCGCGNCTFLGYLENGCPSPMATISSFPYLNTSGLTDKQQQELRSRLRVESQEIMFKFQQLLSRVYESLCAQNISVKKLVTHLLILGALDPVSKDSQKPLLQTFSKELQNAGSIEKVLYIINDYFSFFNYHVIEHIVSGLGTEQDKVELQNYKKEFQKYSKRRIYECPPIFGPISNAGHVLLDLKVDSAYEQFTVKELENFRYRLSKIFCVSSKGVLRLCQVEKDMQQEIFPLSSEQERALAAEGVIKLTCGDYQFAAKRHENKSECEDTDDLGNMKVENKEVQTEVVETVEHYVQAEDTTQPGLEVEDQEVQTEVVGTMEQSVQATQGPPSISDYPSPPPTLHPAVIQGDTSSSHHLLPRPEAVVQLIQGEFGYRKAQLIKTARLGTGSYGIVYKAMCDDLPCAGKILHSIFFQSDDPGAMTIMKQFQQECSVLSAIRHPNIVQYLGSYKDPESELPVLLMELMDNSLTQFLEHSEESLPYHTQVDICHDIALALAYLHSNDIIHRDLSSNNVLLIGAGNRAKVTDFGMAKLFDVNCSTMTPLTMCPGTQPYMSPEALDDPPVYTKKLDSFSFGVLGIQIITRQFPKPSPRTKKVQDPRDPKRRLHEVVPDIERRKSHLDLINLTHPLLSIVTHCLSEEDRPSAQELCCHLALLKKAPQYGESVQQAQERSRAVHRERQIKELQREEEFHEQIQVLQQQLHVSYGQVQEKDRVLTVRQQEYEAVTQEKDCIIEAKETQLQELNQQLAASEQVTAQLQQKIQELQEENQQKIDKFPLVRQKDDLGNMKVENKEIQTEVVETVEQYVQAEDTTQGGLEVENQEVQTEVVETVEQSVQAEDTTQEQEEQVQVLEKELQECHDEREEDMKHTESLETEIEELRRQVDHSQPSSMETTGYLRGVDVIAETSVLITNQAQTFNWAGYGLKLNVPKGALPAGLEECRLLIKVGLSGQFALPENTSLVSAVYWLDSEPRQEFSKHFTLEIQHCVKPTDTSKLSFVRAKCSQTDLPYKFKNVEGGVFSSSSAYGCVQCNHFSLFGAVSDIYDRLYYASIYYLRKGVNSNRIRIYFVITKNLETHATFVQRKYNTKGAILEEEMAIEFESDSISLQGVIPEDGWEKISVLHPTITKEEVDSFKSGRPLIPSCQLKAKWTKRGNPSDFICELTLKGAKEPSRIVIDIDCADALPDTPTLNSEPKLADLMNEVAAKIPSKWRDIGLQLGVDQDVLEGIAHIGQGDTNLCYINVFTRWKNHNLRTHPYTWLTVVQALQTASVGKERLADEIANKLTGHPLK